MNDLFLVGYLLGACVACCWAGRRAYLAGFHFPAYQQRRERVEVFFKTPRYLMDGDILTVEYRCSGVAYVVRGVALLP